MALSCGHIMRIGAEPCSDVGGSLLPETTPAADSRNPLAASVLASLLRGRQQMAEALAIQDQLIAHYRAAVRT